ncbi:enoyl-CoA hydratase/isomerase family protein [Actinomadura sp. GC306]|uniref:enoyl-CoA hydratase/isomerase family protein n=1 Tax=Actinomadura sp. GC306 TaxID=2530367 RepID=UPI00104DB926|nr:enoyl-CoA hydratase/isomerase family protein [Actinomadura sp. GC306]TDC71573.1 enoyl-CoA hydratase/isomerase family protein [Actinomadura sp. GC306]
MITTSFDRGIARMTLDNPRRKNAITLDMAAAMEEFCARVRADEAIGAAVIDAEGGYFCSGADTRDLADSSADPASPEAVARTSAVYNAFVGVGRLPVPSVSLVAGGAVGAGLNLALATDLMIVTPDAVLDSGFLARGIHPGGGHLALLGRAAGYRQAVALGVLGAALTGTEAVRRGLAWAAVPPGELLGTATRLVAKAAADPALARRIKDSAALELGPPAVPWSAAVEIERGVQMWSLGRKGHDGWARRPAAPGTGADGG